MPISHEVIYGGLLEYNKPPLDVPKAVIHVPGEFKGKKQSFGITEDLLSKHILLVGGTGCGKTNLFYHMVQQIKAKLTANEFGFLQNQIVRIMDELRLFGRRYQILYNEKQLVFHVHKI